MFASRPAVILQKGSQGAAVKSVQKSLNSWLKNYYYDAAAPLVEDGIFGEKTERIVKFYQCRFLLEIDGIVGPETRGCMERGVASFPILSQGSRSPFVARLQKVLSLYGINPGPIDGIYGPKTRAAVEAFQRNNAVDSPIIKVSGVVDLPTWNVLIYEPTAIACGPIQMFRG